MKLTVLIFEGLQSPFEAAALLQEVLSAGATSSADPRTDCTFPGLVGRELGRRQAGGCSEQSSGPGSFDEDATRPGRTASQVVADEMVARVEDDAFKAAFCAQFGHAATATNSGDERQLWDAAIAFMRGGPK